MSSLWASWQGSSVCVGLVGMSGLEWAGGATGEPGLLQTWLLWLNGPDQSHWTSLWQWVKVLRHGTAFLNTTALGMASRPAGRRTQPLLPLSLGSPSRWSWQGRRRQVCRQSQAPIHPETSDERDYGDVEKDGVDGGCTRVSQVWAGLHTVQLGRAGLVWPEAWCWIVVWGYSGNGGPRHWYSTVTCLRSALAPFLSECECVVSRGRASSVFGCVQRWGRASYAGTLKRQSWRKIWPILPKGGRVFMCTLTTHTI